MAKTATHNRPAHAGTRGGNTFATLGMVALIVFTCAAFVGVDAYRIIDKRTEVLAEAELDASNLASSLIQHAELTFRTADALLVAAVYEIEHRPFTPDELSNAKAVLTMEVEHSSQFVSFAIMDRTGKLVASTVGGEESKVGADREYFIYHQTHSDRDLHIGVPVRARISQKWVIPVSRRFNLPDGSFGGVIVAAVNPRFFQDVYDRLHIGKTGTIILASLGGKLLVRRPFVEDNVGQDVSKGGVFLYLAQSSSGTVEITSPIDGHRRISSYEKSKIYPVVVAVAQTSDELLAPWRKDTARRLTEAGPIVVLMLILAGVIWYTNRNMAAQAADLREANDRFDVAINAMSHGLCQFDPDGRLVISNLRFREFYQLNEQDSAPGTPVARFLQLAKERGAELLQSSQQVADVSDSMIPQNMIRLKEGTIIAIRRAATPDGGWVSIHEDITERERAAKILAERLDDLVKARNAAEAASRAKSDFLAMMSHEIRTPMAGMMGMIDLLSGTHLDQEQQDLARIAQESARNLLTVVNNILDFSKLEAGQLTPEAIAFDIDRTIDSVAALLGPKASGQGLVLETSLAADLPRHLVGDPSRIAQVLLNLVGNAIKFTERGTVAIAASHRALDDAAVELRIEVRDTGTGISPDVQRMLFTPFTQADSSVSRKYGGTGLGLAICRQLCQAMGGDIGVDSALGQGSRFWFTVRCRIGEAPQITAPSLVPALAAHADEVEILVADDNDIIRTLIAKLLARRGYRPDLVHNGREAIEAVQRKCYHLVLMDMQMPELDGIAAARLIRGLSGPERDVPIIALTANALVGQREICLAAGMNSFLTKPIQPDALYEAIQRWGVVEAGEGKALGGAELAS